MVKEKHITTSHVIAVDGPSGSGKSSMSRLLASAIGFKHIDTGAMYRAIALTANDLHIGPYDISKLGDLCLTCKIAFDSGRIFVNGKDLTPRIREPFVSSIVSSYSAVKLVRDSLVRLQRNMGGSGKVVMEGRDIGTVVFPNADLKFYLDAEYEVRAWRRHKELDKAGVKVEWPSLLEGMKKRDEKDSSRSVSPLLKADDAFYIDTSDLSRDDVFRIILDKTVERLGLGDTGYKVRRILLRSEEGN